MQQQQQRQQSEEHDREGANLVHTGSAHCILGLALCCTMSALHRWRICCYWASLLCQWVCRWPVMSCRDSMGQIDNFSGILAKNVIGQPAPDFQMDLTMPDGTSKRTSLSLWRNAQIPVVIDFFAPWCASCLVTAQRLDTLAQGDFMGRCFVPSGQRRWRCGRGSRICFETQHQARHRCWHRR